jgi:ADP-ribose pyrophosphatase YjhB (NUDIX family)
VALRIDFYDDPAAPEANSMVPSVNVVVTNSAGAILLIRRSDNQNWAVPGGAIDLGESMVQAGVRETKEETGIDCEITGLVGIYTDPKHQILYTSNGEVRQEFSIVLTARATGGTPTRSDESSDVRWVAREDLGEYAMDRSMRLRLGHFLEGRTGPYLGLAALASLGAGCFRVHLAHGLQDHRCRAAH